MITTDPTIRGSRCGYCLFAVSPATQLRGYEKVCMWKLVLGVVFHKKRGVLGVYQKSCFSHILAHVWGMTPAQHAVTKPNDVARYQT